MSQIKIEIFFLIFSSFNTYSFDYQTVTELESNSHRPEIYVL